MNAAQLTSRVEQLIQPHIEAGDILGLSLALIQGNDVVYSGGFGKTSTEESGVPVTPNTLFALGSVCKTLCAVLVMRLVEASKINLDTPVIEYIPELKFSNDDLGKKVTIRHLLSHTSGLPAFGKTWGSRDPDSLKRFVLEQVPYYTFFAQPGEIYLYASSAFCIAGYVAEVVTGRYYDDLIREYVFEPLGMTCTSFDPTEILTYSVALPHDKTADGSLKVSHQIPYNVSGNPSGFAYGSILDLTQLAKMFLNSGRLSNELLLQPSSLALMTAHQGSLDFLPSTRPLKNCFQKSGLGIFTGNYRSRAFWGHDGRMPEYLTFLHLFPEDNTALVVMTNNCDEAALYKVVPQIYNALLDLPEAPEPNETVIPPAIIQNVEHLEYYVGQYFSGGVFSRVLLVGNQLMLELENTVLTLFPIGENHFYAYYPEKPHFSVRFLRAFDTRISHVVIAGRLYERMDIDETFQSDLITLETYEGLYKDPSNTRFDQLLQVKLKDEKIIVSESGFEMPCTALSNTLFLCPYGLIEFRYTKSNVPILVWGKATPYFAINQMAWKKNKVVQYLAQPYTG
ncbi:MAG: hypothetical protein RLZZ156_2178 [Deinococcota bacterium]|jgi:CubicO group peptidase (beta-lactamase class C family)